MKNIKRKTVDVPQNDITHNYHHQPGRTVACNTCTLFINFLVTTRVYCSTDPTLAGGTRDSDYLCPKIFPYSGDSNSSPCDPLILKLVIAASPVPPNSLNITTRRLLVQQHTTRAKRAIAEGGGSSVKKGGHRSMARPARIDAPKPKLCVSLWVAEAVAHC
jgi:hypothetical protein